MSKEIVQFRKQMREAFAEYQYSEGCSCCRDSDAHSKASIKIGKLLKVPQYSDKSGYDFSKFRPKTP